MSFHAKWNYCNSSRRHLNSFVTVILLEICKCAIDCLNKLLAKDYFPIFVSFTLNLISSFWIVSVVTYIQQCCVSYLEIHSLLIHYDYEKYLLKASLSIIKNIKLSRNLKKEAFKTKNYLIVMSVKCMVLPSHNKSRV